MNATTPSHPKTCLECVINYHSEISTILFTTLFRGSSLGHFPLHRNSRTTCYRQGSSELSLVYIFEKVFLVPDRTGPWLYNMCVQLLMTVFDNIGSYRR